MAKAYGDWNKVKNVRLYPSLVSFEFTNSKKEPIKEIQIIKEDISYEMFVELSFVNVRDNWKANYDYKVSKYINFCIYEVNTGGKGYRVIGFLDYEIPEALIMSNFTLFVPLITLDINTMPLQIGQALQDVVPRQDYNFTDTYLSLKTFYSAEKINDISEIDHHFYSIEDSIIDAKLPFVVKEQQDEG